MPPRYVHREDIRTAYRGFAPLERCRRAQGSPAGPRFQFMYTEYSRAEWFLRRAAGCRCLSREERYS